MHTFMDWDDSEEAKVEIEKTAEDYRIRWKSILNETVGMILLQMLSNLLMLGSIHLTSEFYSKFTISHLSIPDSKVRETSATTLGSCL